MAITYKCLHFNNILSFRKDFPYLGSIISKDNGGTDKDVAVRTKKARVVFGMLNTV